MLKQKWHQRAAGISPGVCLRPWLSWPMLPGPGRYFTYGVSVPADLLAFLLLCLHAQRRRACQLFAVQASKRWGQERYHRRVAYGFVVSGKTHGAVIRVPAWLSQVVLRASIDIPASP